VSVDSTPDGNGGSEGNGRTARFTEAGSRMRAKARLAGVTTTVMRRFFWCTESAVAKGSSGRVWPFAMIGNKMMWSRPDWLLPPFAPWLGVAQALMLVVVAMAERCSTAPDGWHIAGLVFCRIELYVGGIYIHKINVPSA
jgi:hypothetical protein